MLLRVTALKRLTIQLECSVLFMFIDYSKSH